MVTYALGEAIVFWPYYILVTAYCGLIFWISGQPDPPVAQPNQVLHRPPAAGIGIGTDEVDLGLVKLRGHHNAGKTLLGDVCDHLAVVSKAPQHHATDTLPQKELRVVLVR